MSTISPRRPRAALPATRRITLSVIAIAALLVVGLATAAAARPGRSERTFTTVMSSLEPTLLEQDQVLTAIVACPAGAVVVGGGYDLGAFPPFDVWSSQPTDDGSGWAVTVRATATAQPEQTAAVTAIARCATT